MQHCEEMLRAHEQQTGVGFDAVLRLRADMIWETRVPLGAAPMPRATCLRGARSRGRLGILIPHGSSCCSSDMTKRAAMLRPPRCRRAAALLLLCCSATLRFS